MSILTKDDIWKLQGMQGQFPSEHYRLEQLCFEVERVVMAKLAQPAPQPLTDEPRYTLQEIADACVYADVSDSKFESISIELNRITAPKGTT